MVNDHWDREKNSATWATLFFYIYYSTDRIAYTTAFVIPVMELWLEIAEWIHHEGLILWPIAPWPDTLP